MSLRSRSLGAGRPPNHTFYRRSFLRHVHHLIGQGFQAISAQDLSAKEEPQITGILTAAIEAFLECPRSPDWVEQYHIQDERHLGDSEREGKKRLRVDIELSSSQHRPRPRFQIEAKRLRDPAQNSLVAYLGYDGLGSFLSGRYAAAEPWAGMMGFVQSDTTEGWIRKIRLELPESSAFRPETFSPRLTDVYRSNHQRSNSDELEVHHFFLNCC